MDIKVIFILRLYFSIDQKYQFAALGKKNSHANFSFCLHIAVKQLKINQVLLVSRKSL